MKLLNEKKLKFLNERKKLKEGLDLLLDAMGELEIAEPSLPLTHYGIKFLKLLRDYTTLYSSIQFYTKVVKEELKKSEALTSLKIRGEAQANGEKVTEGIVEARINSDDEIFNMRLLKGEFEATEELVEKEINLIIEIIQMLKKIADIKATVNVKLNTNFEIGD